MQTLRIFISSPGDVAEERDRARQVVEGLRRRYDRHFILKPVLWEELPLQADMSFQQGIDLVLSREQGVDIAVFILWSRLGSPVGALIQKPGGGSYRSGTEREFDLMLMARKQSRDATSGARPHVLIYTRRDEVSFEERLRGKSTSEKDQLIQQKKLVEGFLNEEFKDAETGTNIRAYHSFDRPVTFSQRLRAHLTELLDQLAGAGIVDAVWDIEKQGPPFLGLEAFQPRHADVFFGREDEVLEIRHALREQARNGCAFVLLSGASGSGKSSLARGGALPAIVENELDEQVSAWRTVIVTPSELAPDPIIALVRLIAADSVLPELRGDDGSLDDLADVMRRNPSDAFKLRLRPALNRASKKAGGGVRLLLVLDQLEELFAFAAITAESRSSFLAMIETLARSGSVWVIATARSDFNPQFQSEPAIVRLKAGAGTLDVLQPAPDALRRVIEEPARLAGLHFEEHDDHSLSDRILRDAAAHPELLPLVEYVLRELFEQRTDEGRLTFAVYEQLGGVEGALAKRAETVFTALPGDAQECLGSVLKSLVTLGRDGEKASTTSAGEERLVRQRAPLAKFPENTPSRALVDAFVKQRLFTTAEHPQTHEPAVTLTHESLLRVWPRAVQWAANSRDFLRARLRLRIALTAWQQEKIRPIDLLLPQGKPLEDARALAKSHAADLSTEELGFIRESAAYHEARERKARQWRNLGFAALSVLTVLTAVGGFIGWQQARKAKAAVGEAKAAEGEATQQRDESRFNEGLAWMLRAQVADERGNQYPDTLLYAGQAIGFDGVGRSAAQTDPIRLIRQDRNAAAYQTARNWIRDRPMYLPVWSSALPAAPATGLTLSPEGRWLAISAGDGSVRLWDLSTGAESAVLESGAKSGTDATFRPDGNVLAVSQGDMVRLWDMKAKAFTTELPGSAAALAYSPDGKILAGAGVDGSLLLWEGGQRKILATGQTKSASRLAYSRDNSAVAVAFPGAGVRLFFPLVGEAASAWETHAGDITAVAISPDGVRLAAGSADGALSLWDVASARLLGEISPEQRHKGAVLDLSFRPDGGQLASASADATLKLWDVTKDVPAITATLTGHVGAVTRVRYPPGGDLLASAGADGSAKLWNVSPKVGADPDLYSYLGQKWYHFEPQNQKPVWSNGTGYLNVPAGSIVGLWQAGGTGIFPSLLAAQNWAGAFVALRDLPESAGAGAAKQLGAALLADAQKAADDYRWNRVDLRIGQLEQLGGMDVSALQQRRKAIAAEGTDFTNGDGLELVWCPAGAFTMGSPETEKGHQSYENQHRVTLTHGFWIGRYTVTQAQWTAVMGSNPSAFPSSEAKAPVETVSWTKAVEFCRKLTDQERSKGAVPPGWEYALPTEAQWEYACRAGTSTAYSFGDDPAQLYKYGNFNDKTGDFEGADTTQDDRYKFAAPIGSYLPNPWKIYDMHGNVGEWCQDSVDLQIASYPEGDAVDPLVRSGSGRVDRGGSWHDTAADCRSASRHANQPSTRLGELGLRPVLVPSRPVEPSEP